MALAYTSPTWTDGSGTGISASQLQALCNCVEGLVQGSDKALHNIAINGSTMTLTFADGSQETASTDVKGISSIAKTGTAGLVDTYTITYTDGSTSTFTITNGSPGVDATAYHPDDADESTLADNDRFPFYDTSASAKRRTTWENIKNKMYDYLNLDFYSKTDSTATTFNDTDYIPRYNANNGTKWKVTWSNVKSLLKTYFDTLYTKTVANPTGTATGTLTKLGIGSDIYSIEGGGGDVSGKADLTLIAPVQTTLTASRAYAVGEQFVYNQVLYKVTQAIASGAAITIGTNAVLVGSVTEQLGKNNTYSTTEEINTGKIWVNGKPIYRRTFYISALPNTAGGALVLDMNTIVDTYVRFYGAVKSSSNTSIPLPYVGTDSKSNDIIISADAGNSQLSGHAYVTVGKDRSNYMGYLTVEYTKA